MPAIAMEEEDDVFNKEWHNLQPLNLGSPHSYSKLWSMVVVKDSIFPTKSPDDQDLSVFPPCNHENLNPSHFNLHPKSYSPPPSIPSSPLPFRPPDSAPSPPPAVVSPFAKWWELTAQILRSGFGSFGSSLGSGNRKSFWSIGNVALAATVVWWWIYLRRRRQRRRMKSVDHLMRIINEKDEKIMELLSQIAKLNEVLLSRHKALTSDLSTN